MPADPVFDAAFDTDAAAQRSGDALLSQVERVRGLGSLRYAPFGTALAEGFGLLRGQCVELLDQQRRPRLATQLLQRQTRSTLQQSQNFVELLRADAGELQSALSDLRQLLARSRRREAPLRGPSWQCQLFNLATRTSVKQSMRTAKSFEELHTALLRIGRGRAPHDFSYAGHQFRAAAVDFRAQIWPGLPHCWPLFGFLPEADAALREVAAHFQGHWDVQAQRRVA